MTQHLPTHLDRQRAGSFGAEAESYDRYRPRYPQQLIDSVVTRPGLRVLDVGAGTGIASAQLADAGADVLAVEPDERMAEIARSKGITVEVASFEKWQSLGRTFELVVFAQSFHWVEPETALAKVATILTPDGRLVLMSNRIRPPEPIGDELGEIAVRIRGEASPPDGRLWDRGRIDELFTQAGYTSERHVYQEDCHYSTQGYLDHMFTYSRQLILDPPIRAKLRAAWAQAIGPDGVDATNNAVAIVARPIR